MATPRPAPATGRSIDVESIDGLIDVLYHAATELEAWPAALDMLRVWACATSVAIVLRPRSGDGRPRVALQTGTPLTSGVIDAVGSAARHLRHDEFRTLSVERTPGSHCVGTILSADPQSFAVLLLARPREENPFAEEARLATTTIVPHIRRAFTISVRMQRLADERDDLAAVLDRVAVGALLVSGDGRVLRANAGALAMVAERDGLGIVGGVFGAASSADAPRLRQLLRQARFRGDEGQVAPPCVLHVARTSLRRPYCVAAIGLPARERGLTIPTRTTLVLVSDSELELGSVASILRDLYGLTPTETEVAAQLLRGARVDTMAATFGISLNTVRTHLKRIFGKVGVGSQSDLVRAVLAGPGRLVGAACAPRVSSVEH